jgi:hypothetical protein
MVWAVKISSTASQQHTISTDSTLHYAHGLCPASSMVDTTTAPQPLTAKENTSCSRDPKKQLPQNHTGDPTQVSIPISTLRPLVTDSCCCAQEGPHWASGQPSVCPKGLTTICEGQRVDTQPYLPTTCADCTQRTGCCVTAEHSIQASTRACA